MKKSFRYGDFLGVVRLKQRALSYNKVAREDHPGRRPHLRAVDVYRLVGPYVAPKALEQLRAARGRVRWGPRRSPSRRHRHRPRFISTA